MHHEQYNAYYDRKKAHKLNKAIARKMQLPVSPAGSEENPKTEIQWQSEYASEMPFEEALDGIQSPPHSPIIPEVSSSRTRPRASSSRAGRADPPGWEGATWDV